MLDDDIQRELLRVKVEPERALSTTVNREMALRNPQRTSSNNNSCVNAIQQFTGFRGAITITQQWNRNTFNREANGVSGSCS